MRKKNKKKTTEYKDEKDQRDLEEMSNLPEWFGDLAELRAFKYASIPQEVPKPPVIGGDVHDGKPEEVEEDEWFWA